ncbi:hypothetical protein [Demequina soli]|uniref:hypothetical protein n=1 Tax=Demequina soli TaxID=1638987 RepID=UPI0007812683|nr:hypothetical protein [Demequina soli]
MPRWGQVLAAIAGVAVGGTLLYGTYLTVEPLLLGDTAPAPAVTSSPELSATPEPSASAEAASLGCDWSALADGQKPPYLGDQADGLPRARLMTEATWDCVDDSWGVAVHSAGGDTWRPGGTAQALYLVAPDGDLLKLFDLRTDVQVVLLESDLDARLAWTARVGEDDTTQVVQVELDTGLVVDGWGGDAVPALQVADDGTVSSVAPLPEFAGDGTLWAGYSRRGTLQSLFVRASGDDFRALGAQKALDSLLADGGVDGAHHAGDEVWVARDGSFAVFLSQRPVKDKPHRTAGGTWVVVDLVNDQWRLAEASLPEWLCSSSPQAYATGTYDDPGVLGAACDEHGTQASYRLTIGGDPQRVAAGVP